MTVPQRLLAERDEGVGAAAGRGPRIPHTVLGRVRLHQRRQRRLHSRGPFRVQAPANDVHPVGVAAEGQLPPGRLVIRQVPVRVQMQMQLPGNSLQVRRIQVPGVSGQGLLGPGDDVSVQAGG
jgi:hypothetical protein